jgi:hypothetical protein
VAGGTATRVPVDRASPADLMQLAGGSGTGLVIVMSHVLADGSGGLAVLARLVDEVPGLPPG